MKQSSFVSASGICSIVHEVFITWTASEQVGWYTHIRWNLSLKLVFFQRLTGLWQVTLLQWLTGQTAFRAGLGNKRLPVFPVRFKAFLSLCWIHFYFGNFYTGAEICLFSQEFWQGWAWLVPIVNTEVSGRERWQCDSLEQLRQIKFFTWKQFFCI